MSALYLQLFIEIAYFAVISYLTYTDNSFTDFVTFVGIYFSVCLYIHTYIYTYVSYYDKK